jgi:hypothetical protein
LAAGATAMATVVGVPLPAAPSQRVTVNAGTSTGCPSSPATPGGGVQTSSCPGPTIVSPGRTGAPLNSNVPFSTRSTRKETASPSTSPASDAANKSECRRTNGLPRTAPAMGSKNVVRTGGRLPACGCTSTAMPLGVEEAATMSG